MTLILALLFMLLFLALMERVYQRSWNRGLEAKLDLSVEEAYPGEQVVLTETISNRKWLPLPMLKVKFSIHRNLAFLHSVENTSVSDKCYKNDIFSILFYQKIIRKHPFVCEHRGYYPFGSIHLIASNLFFERSQMREYPVQKALIVYPRILDMRDFSILFEQIMGEITVPKRNMPDPFTFAGIREYQPFDTMRMINWKASAKTGELKVNVRESTANKNVCILLNLELDGILRYDLLMEAAVSLACTLACRLTEKGICVSLFSNGLDARSQKEPFFQAGGGAGHRRNILLSLSCMDLNLPMRNFWELMEEKRQETAQSFCLLISPFKKAEVVERFLELPDALWVLPFHQGMDCCPVSVPKERVLPWKVERNQDYEK